MKLFKEKPNVFCKDCEHYFKLPPTKKMYNIIQEECLHPDNVIENTNPITGKVTVSERSVVFYTWNKYLNCKRYKEKEIG